MNIDAAIQNLHNGANIRDVQAAMGHKYIDTTAGYITPNALRVESPLKELTHA